MLFALLASVLFAQSLPSPSREVVTIDKLTMQGTRFTPHSIQILTGLRPGLQIDELAVRQAIARMLESGLIRSVDYNYESLADPHRVILELTVVDETPLLPASIEIPGVDPEAVWQYLASIDPLFTRELPRTEKPCGFTYVPLQIICARISVRNCSSPSSLATTPAILAESSSRPRPAARHPASARTEKPPNPRAQRLREPSVPLPFPSL